MVVNGVNITKPNFFLYNRVSGEIIYAESDLLPSFFREQADPEYIVVQADTRQDLVDASTNLTLQTQQEEFSYLSPYEKWIEVVLLAANWSTNLQTVIAPNVTANSIVQVFPKSNRTDYENYSEAKIIAITLGLGTVTFECDSVPTSNINAVIYIIEK